MAFRDESLSDGGVVLGHGPASGLRRRRRKVVAVFGVLFGLSLCLWPVLTDMWFAADASKAISDHENTIRVDDVSRERALDQARAYNALMAGTLEPGTVDQVLPYDEQLVGNDGYMCWLEIKRIALSVPVWHGATEDVLAKGAGHVENTSLPVGGVPSNCVISAHTGLRTARMFDDIGRLGPGDVCLVHTFGETLAYEFESSEVVEPDDLSHLGIYDRDVDMLTLLTCTPFGVNDHRLLVHMRRTEYRGDRDVVGDMDAYVNHRTVPPIVAGLLVIVVAIGTTTRVSRRSKA